MKPVTDKAYKLFHQGVIALSQVESNGIRIDVGYLKQAISTSDKQIKHITERMKKDKVYKAWKKKYGTKTNLESNDQLGKVLFNVLKYECINRTATGKPSTDIEALSKVKIKFVKDHLKVAKLRKARSTYLVGILKHVDPQGYIHPSFNLHLVQTMRGQSNDPNFTNIPVRDPKIKKLVRQAFIASPGHRIVEVDYSGVEIGAAACYHKDPRMLKYIKNNKLDMHRDMAMQIYKCTKEEMTKDIRYCGKNKFVFPQFYGDWYLSCAKSLWGAMGEMNLKTSDGVKLQKHLKRNGIKTLGACNSKERPEKGTFEHHLKEIESDFWDRRFKVYGRWKEDWWDAYLTKGCFDTLTGFRIDGEMNRKEVINYPIQGTAFHWLLWSLIRVQKQLNKYKMKSKIVGQIHDSIVGDVHRKERQDYLEICQQVMTIDVRKHWPWIIVPLSIEAEITPVDGNWYQKKEIII